MDRARKGAATQLDVSRAAAQVSTTEAQPSSPSQPAMAGDAPPRRADRTTARRPGGNPFSGEAGPDAAGGGARSACRRNCSAAGRTSGGPSAILAAATARVGMATADLYPRFSLTGSFSLQSSNFSDLARWDSRTFGFGPAVLWPIFDAGRLRAVVQAQRRPAGAGAGPVRANRPPIPGGSSRRHRGFHHRTGPAQVLAGGGPRRARNPPRLPRTSTGRA